MDNNGMTYELALEPFILRGAVGEEARLLMQPGNIFDGEPSGARITGRKSVEELIDRLYTLQSIAADLNGNKGPWAYSFAQEAKTAGSEAQSDGVSV